MKYQLDKPVADTGTSWYYHLLREGEFAYTPFTCMSYASAIKFFSLKSFSNTVMNDNRETCI